MNVKKWLCAAAALCLCLSMAACSGDGTAVYVQRVEDLSGSGMILPGDRFPGVVVAENTTRIDKDQDKSVAELYVKAGDDVTEGQELFSYDTDELQLALDKQRLEQEQLETMIGSYTEQIAELETAKKTAPQDEQLQYTVEIQSLEVQLKEAQLNLEAKKKDVARSEDILNHAVVLAPVTGRIRSINEKGVDSNGNPAAYIVIQQEGSFRVEGSLGELQRGGIQEGSRMKILSRTDPEQFWMGTVALVDYENPTQSGGNYGMIMPGYGTESSLTNASSYPFYVALDSTEGLILGQHVYMELDSGELTDALRLPAGFVGYLDDGSTFVWADRGGRLEQRAVTLGEYDFVTDSYIVTDGLTGEDYIAFPDEWCAEGASTTKELPKETEEPGDLPVAEGGVA